MRVLVHSADASQWCKLLRKGLPEGAVVVSSTQDADTPADYLVVWHPPESLLRRQSSAKAMLCLGAGVDALLANPGLNPDMPVIKLRDAGMAPLMVEYVRYGVMHYRLNFDHYLAAETASHWQQEPRPAPADWPVGILGLGAIGRNVAQSMAADGYPVHGWSRSPKTVSDIVCHHGPDGLRQLLREVKTLVALLPDTDRTRGILDAEAFAQMPQGASLINPGRGQLLKPADLIDALDRGHLRGALLDAFTTEPLPPEDPLWNHPKIRITPHAAAPTPQGDAAAQVAETIQAIERGESVETVERSVGY